MDHHARYEDSLPRRELDILTEDVTPVLHLFKFFAARDDSAVTLAPEGRQILAQCVSTGNSVKDRRAPERGGRTGAECFFRPVPGLANLLYGPRARALGYSLALRVDSLGCGYAACGAANRGCRRLSGGASRRALQVCAYSPNPALLLCGYFG